MREMFSAHESPHYRKFTEDRDKTLERFHWKLQARVSDILSYGLEQVIKEFHVYYHEIEKDKFYYYRASQSLVELKNKINSHLLGLHRNITEQIALSLTRSYKFTHASETEAISRIVKTQTKQDPMLSYKANKYVEEEIGYISSRVELALNRLSQKIQNAVELSRVMESPLSDALERLKKSFPPVVSFKRAPRVLKPIKEADVLDKKTKDARIASGFMTDEEWQELIDESDLDYKSLYRAPEHVFDVPDNEGDLEERYGWELEQDMTDQWVRSIRDGQNDAANDQGIVDMIWISIIDDRTDECCVWRDGLTSSEIEAKLDSDHKDDECDAIVPPAHFNCRCKPAPALEYQPEPPPSNAGDFQDWLNS